MYFGEKFNAWTHLVGAVLALVGAVVLIVLAALQGDPWKIVSVSIYGATLVLLYTFSTLYHSLRGRAKDVLRELDHHSIYLLIATSCSNCSVIMASNRRAMSLPAPTFQTEPRAC